MRKPIALLIVIAVMFTSLVCNLRTTPTNSPEEPTSPPELSFPDSTSPDPTSTPVEPLSTPDLFALAQADRERLLDLINNEVLAGEVLTWDFNEDGITEEFAYAFEIKTIQDRLYVNPNLVYTLAGPDEYIRSMRLDFNNFNTEPRQVDYVYEIPKEFAAHVDELEFSSPPAEIIQPDPIIRIRLELGGYSQSGIVPVSHASFSWLAAPYPRQDDTFRAAYTITPKKNRVKISYDEALITMLSEAYNIARSDCFKKEGEERNSCLVDLVIDFRKYLGRNASLELCDEITDSSRTYCRAFATDINACSEFKDKNEREFCRGFWIAMECNDLPQVDQLACTVDWAIRENVLQACWGLPNRDQQYYCAAHVTHAPSLCDLIENQVLYQSCLDNLAGIPATPADVYEATKAPPTETVPRGGLIRADQFKSEDCDLFVGAFSHMQIWNVRIDGVGLGCEFDNGLDLNDPAYRAAHVAIGVFDSVEEATAFFDKNYGEEFRNHTQENIDDGTPIAAEYQDDQYFLSQTITSTRYNNEGRARWQNTVIFYDQTRLESKSPEIWGTVVAIATGLLQARAGP